MKGKNIKVYILNLFIIKLIEKSVNFLRLVALCQSLMSLSEKHKDEIKLFDQSVLFYSQINDLIEGGYITKLNKNEQNINKWKLQWNVDSFSIKDLCKKINIKFEDFLKFQS